MSVLQMQSALEKFDVGSATVIKNITKEVIRDCAKIDVFIDESVVSMAVRLLCLDPSGGLQLNQSYDRRELEVFVSHCVDRLKDSNRAWVKTICMQVFFLEHSIDAFRIISYQENQVRDKTNKLLQDILTAHGKSPLDREKLFKKITVDIIVNNFLGSVSNNQLVVEISAALSSVLTKDLLVHFVSLNREQRLNLVHKYRSIVCGIYIYNKDAGLCGGEILDVATIVQNGHLTTETQVNIALDEVGCRLKLLNTVLSKHRDVLVIKQIKDPAVKADVLLMHETLILQTQHMEYVRSLSRSLTKIKMEIDNALKTFRAKLVLIRSKVEFKTAIPTNEIFPHFEELSECWRRLQNCIFIVSEVKLVNERLIELNDEVLAWENTAMDLLAETTNIAVPQETMTSMKKIVSTNPNVKVIDKKKHMKIEFNGFCASCLTKGDSYLQKANLDIGVCVYKDKNYAFVSHVAAKCFLDNPEVLLFNVVAIARAHPELIVLLDVFELVKAHRNDFHGFKRTTIVTTQNHAAIQTEVHPIESHIDRKYVWNIWDYRRQAIQYANLLNEKTTSAQTAVGYQRYGVETQTGNPRESSAQTDKDAATNVPRPKRYVRGQRGTSGGPCRDVKLTDYVEDDVLTQNKNV